MGSNASKEVNGTTSRVAPVMDDSKPLLRGWFHLIMLPVAAVLGLVLVGLANGVVATWSSVAFAISSLLMFGTSATYHRGNWKPATKALLKRLDHANIFVLIAGTYTPIGMLAVPWSDGFWLLLAVWIGASIGILFRVVWVGAPRWLYTPLYVLLGWGALAYMPQLFGANAVMATLVLVGGVAYTVGAVCYALKKPNPIPGVFGFHEIFHALTVIAFVCHWVAVLLIATNPVF